MVLRLGRNMLMGQYHDVVAPMLLSRTVFVGLPRTMMSNDRYVKEEQQQDDDVATDR